MKIAQLAASSIALLSLACGATAPPAGGTAPADEGAMPSEGRVQGDGVSICSMSIAGISVAPGSR